MDCNNGKILPPQGARIPRGRRGEGIVPAQSPSTSCVGLFDNNVTEVNRALKVSSSKSSISNGSLEESDRKDNQPDEENPTYVLGDKSEESEYNSDGSESSHQRLVRESKQWSTDQLNDHIQDLIALMQYNSKHGSCKSGPIGREHELFIDDSIRKVRVLTSRLMFKADKLKVQVSKLEKDNAKLSKRLEVVEKDIIALKNHRQMSDIEVYPSPSKVNLSTSKEDTKCNQEDVIQEDKTKQDTGLHKIKEDTLQDSAISTFVKTEDDTSLRDHIADKADIYMSALTMKIQPLIRDKFLRLCECSKCQRL